MAVGNLLEPYDPVITASPWRTAALSAPAWWASVLPWWASASSAPPCVGVSSALVGFGFLCSALVGLCFLCSALVGLCFLCSALVGLCFICSALPGLLLCLPILSSPVQPMRCLSSGLCCYWSIWNPLLLGGVGRLGTVTVTN